MGVYRNRRGEGLGAFAVDVGLGVDAAVGVKAVVAVKGALTEGVEFLGASAVRRTVDGRKHISAFGTGVVDRGDDVSAPRANSSEVHSAVSIISVGVLPIGILIVRILIIGVLAVGGAVGILPACRKGREALLRLVRLFRGFGVSGISPLAFGAVKLLVSAAAGLIVTGAVVGSSAHGADHNVVVILEFHLADGTTKPRITIVYVAHLLKLLFKLSLILLLNCEFFNDKIKIFLIYYIAPVFAEKKMFFPLQRAENNI